MISRIQVKKILRTAGKQGKISRFQDKRFFHNHLGDITVSRLKIFRWESISQSQKAAEKMFLFLFFQ